MPRLGPHHSINGDWQTDTGSGTFQRRESVHHTSLSKGLTKKKKKKKRKIEKYNAGPKSPFDTPPSNLSTANHQLLI